MEESAYLARITSAISNIKSSTINKQIKVHEQVQEIGDSLMFLSDNIDQLVVDNVINLIDLNQITIFQPARFKEKVFIKPMPHTNFLMFKYLQKFNYSKVSSNVIMTLHDAIIRWAFRGKHVLELLKILKVLYNCQYFCPMVNVLNALRRLSYQRQKYLNKQLSLTVEHFISAQLNNTEQDMLLEECLAIQNFGNIEYSICCSIVKRKTLNYKIRSLMKFVMAGLQDNNLSYGASQLFGHIIDLMNFEEFYLHIHPYLEAVLNNPPLERARTLTANFTKYVIPKLCKKFEERVYRYFDTFEIFFKLNGYKYMSISKSRLQDRVMRLHIIEEVSRGSDTTLKKLALELLCQYSNARVQVTHDDIKLFKELVFAIHDANVDLRHSIRQFISQILISQYYFNDLIDLRKYVDFYRWINHLANAHAASSYVPLTQIVSELYVFSMKALKHDSSFLVLPYKAFATYTINPLTDLIYTELNITIESNLLYMYHVYTNIAINAPIVEYALSKLHFDSLSKEMIQETHLRTICMLSTNNPWIKKRAVVSADMLLNYYAHAMPSDIAILKTQIETVIASALETFSMCTSSEEAEKFDISTPLRIMNKAVLHLSNDLLDYEEECIAYENRIYTIVSNYTRLNNDRFFRNKIFRKNVEASLLVLIKYHYQILKNLGYEENAVDRYCKVVDTIITHISMKKVVAAITERFHKLIRATPQYQIKYITFYSTIRIKYVYNSATVTLRKSAGFRNIMFVILKAVDSPCFQQKEIETLISDYTLDIHRNNLRLNLLELLISDPHLKSTTQIYIPAVFEKALKNLNHNQFLIRNSSIQLITVIATRLLGPISENGTRELAINDAFTVYPEIAELVNRHLFSTTDSIDVKIAILSFLGESNHKGSLYMPATFDIGSLKTLFSHETLSYFAADAFVTCIADNLLYDILLAEFNSLSPLFNSNILFMNYQMRNIKRLVERFMNFDDEFNEIIKEQKKKLRHLFENCTNLWTQPFNMSKHIDLPERPSVERLKVVITEDDSDDGETDDVQIRIQGQESSTLFFLNDSD